MPTVSADYIYWAFSSASQSIAAFVAFLLTGYALVHALVESARYRDATLDEVHTELRTTRHRRLRALAWLTGAAVVLSLAVVYVNWPGAPPTFPALVAVALIDLAAVILGLAFVVSIVNPAKYQQAAENGLGHRAAQSKPAKSSVSEFFDEFMHLERLVRDFLRARDL